MDYRNEYGSRDPRRSSQRPAGSYEGQRRQNLQRGGQGSSQPRQASASEVYHRPAGRSQQGGHPNQGRSPQARRQMASQGHAQPAQGRSRQSQQGQRPYAGLDRRPAASQGAYSRSSYGSSSHRGRQAYDAKGRSGQVRPVTVSGNYGMGFGSGRRGGFNFKMPLVIALVAVVVVVAVVFGIKNWNYNKAVDVTINGTTMTVEKDQRLVKGLFESGTLVEKPGDLLAVDGSVLEKGGGEKSTVTVNGEKIASYDIHLNAGDEVVLSEGADVTEGYTDSDSKKVGYKTRTEGSGAMHLYTSVGKDGVQVTRTGAKSGKTVKVYSEEPADTVMTYYNVNTGKDKVIALTFDDGPWPTTTGQILDILKSNGAKATFFTIGEQIPNFKDTVARMASEGHQVCTHSYDHASGSGQGVNITYMSAAEQKNEIQKGYDAIAAATGDKKVSTVVRLPGGNINDKTVEILKGLMTCEVGWNLDTEDWRRPGADVIYRRIVSAQPGDIILMHDGGGDRTQTVAALKKALPVLKEKGYSFVTIDEMLEKYPYK